MFNMPQWLANVCAVLLALLPLGLWIAWWLGAANWKRVWPALAAGAWAPVLLLMAVATLAWSRLDARPYDFLGVVSIPNVWWQLGAVCALAAAALLCGWLQGYLGWTPEEVSLEPPVSHDEHDPLLAHMHAHEGHAEEHAEEDAGGHS
jgi:hypothetical protein